MIAIKIDQSLTCEKVCQKIQSILKNLDRTNKLLVIDIKEITQENDLILKLEYHE